MGRALLGAFLITLAFSFAGGIAIERLLFKPLAKAPILTNVAGFIALYAIINSVAGLIWDFTIKQYPTPFGSSPLPRQPADLDPPGRHDRRHRAAADPACSFSSSSRGSGLAMRARRALPESARLVGINTSLDDRARLGHGVRDRRDRRHADRAGGVLEPNMMLGVLIYGFAAAVLGGLTSAARRRGRRLPGRRVRESRRDLYSRASVTKLKLPIALALIITVLVVKPAGLFGRPIVKRV